MFIIILIIFILSFTSMALMTSIISDLGDSKKIPMWSTYLINTIIIIFAFVFSILIMKKAIFSKTMYMILSIFMIVISSFIVSMYFSFKGKSDSKS